MPDVLRCSGIDCVLGDVRCVIADALKRSGNEHQVQIPAKLVSVLGHSLD
jgi:hypothetical protein